jgi:hypothetical protein
LPDRARRDRRGEKEAPPEAGRLPREGAGITATASVTAPGATPATAAGAPAPSASGDSAATAPAASEAPADKRSPEWVNHIAFGGGAILYYFQPINRPYKSYAELYRRAGSDGLDRISAAVGRDGHRLPVSRHRRHRNHARGARPLLDAQRVLVDRR